MVNRNIWERIFTSYGFEFTGRPRNVRTFYHADKDVHATVNENTRVVIINHVIFLYNTNAVLDYVREHFEQSF